MTNFPSFAAPSAAPYAPTYNSNRTVPMGDMIDRDAALATIQQQLALWESGTLVCGLDDLLRLYLPQAIAALKPVTQPAPDAAFASGFKAGLKAAAEHWFRGVSGVRQLLPETKAQILAIPCPQPAPDALPRCAECSCDDGNCTWIATDDDIYPYDAIEQCERDLDGDEDEPVVNEKLEAALRKVADKVYAKLSAKGLYAEAQSARDTILAALRAGGVA